MLVWVVGSGFFANGVDDSEVNAKLYGVLQKYHSEEDGGPRADDDVCLHFNSSVKAFSRPKSADVWVADQKRFFLENLASAYGGCPPITTTVINLNANQKQKTDASASLRAAGKAGGARSDSLESASAALQDLLQWQREHQQAELEIRRQQLQLELQRADHSRATPLQPRAPVQQAADVAQPSDDSRLRACEESIKVVNTKLDENTAALKDILSLLRQVGYCAARLRTRAALSVLECTNPAPRLRTCCSRALHPYQPRAQ